MLPQMDAQQALADLTEISSQIQAAAIFDSAGKVAASTFADADRGAELARSATELLEQADNVAATNGTLVQLEIATFEGSVFVVREGETRIAAVTGPEPTVGLVFYDLKSALRQLGTAEAKPAPGRKTTTRKKTTSGGTKKTTTGTAKKTTTRRKKTDAS
jgi:predicted regulator of Ras-like GTPase activity (Roadblock/LC7/MglB family)